MSTLKMKVLLILSNRYLHRAVWQALMIWITTCLGGCVTLYAFEFLMFPPLKAFVLSLIFSSPALLVAIPFLYHLTAIQDMLTRITSAISIILFTSGAIVGFVAMFFNLRYSDVAKSLLFFIPSALVCFFLIAWKQILKTKPQ